MQELLDELEPTFGAAKMFRPYRDVRFSKDKSPYKTRQYAVVHLGGAGSAGIAGSVRRHRRRRPAPRRRAVPGHHRAGAAHAHCHRRRRAPGANYARSWTSSWPRVSSSPVSSSSASRSRGTTPIPRADLLRYKALTAHVAPPAGPLAAHPKAKDEVVTRWKALGPLNAWMGSARDRVAAGRVIATEA